MFFSFVINPSCFGSGELGSKPHCQRAREPPGQRQHEVRGRYWGYSGLMQGRQHSIPWMTPGYCSQNEDGSPSEEQSQDSLLELVRQRRTVDWIRQADCYLQLKKNSPYRKISFVLSWSWENENKFWFYDPMLKHWAIETGSAPFFRNKFQRPFRDSD